MIQCYCCADRTCIMYSSHFLLFVTHANPLRLDRDDLTNYVKMLMTLGVAYYDCLPLTPAPPVSFPCLQLSPPRLIHSPQLHYATPGSLTSVASLTRYPCPLPPFTPLRIILRPPPAPLSPFLRSFIPRSRLPFAYPLPLSLPPPPPPNCNPNNPLRYVPPPAPLPPLSLALNLPPSPASLLSSPPPSSSLVTPTPALLV